MFDFVVCSSGGMAYVLKMCKNLISLSLLDYQGYGYFANGGVIKVTQGNMVMMKGNLHNDLYSLKGEVSKGQEQCIGNGSDKSQICIYFTLIYLVFYLVYYYFVHIHVCFYLVSGLEPKDRRSEEKGPKQKMEQLKAYVATQDCMPQHVVHRQILESGVLRHDNSVSWHARSVYTT